MTSIEMRKDRAKLIADAGAILKKATDEGRKAMSTEEDAQFTRLHDEADSLLKQIEKIELHEKRQTELAATAIADRTADPDPDGGGDDDPSDELRAMRARKTARHEQEAFRSFLRGGWAGIPQEQRAVAMRHRASAATMKEIAGSEARTAQTVTTTGGGYLIPRAFQKEVDHAMLAFAQVKSACRVITTPTGNPLDWPTVDDTAIKGRLLGINAAITNTGFTVGTVAFVAYKFSSDSILVPSELMQDADMGESLDTFLRDMLAERLGRILADYFTTGTGSSQPQGIVAGATASGISGFDLSDLTSPTTAYTWYDQLVGLEHSVDPAYRIGGAFMMHDTMLRDLKKVKDTTGRPIWQPGAMVGSPDTILGYPYFINQSMANTGTNANIPIIFGNLKKFVVREVRPMVLLRLVERYADNDQTGFIAFSREDSHLIDAGTHPIKSATVVT
jgi:HK97 family phage major capsid protein